MILRACNVARSTTRIHISFSPMKKVLLLLCLILPIHLAAQDFVIEDIRIEGLQRVSPGSVFAVLPARVGDRVDSYGIQDSIRALFATGFFADIRVERDGNVLVIVVAERPAISEINLEGNRVIPTASLMDSLRQSGLAQGQIFRPATLDGMARALEREYVAQGHYSANIEANTRELPQNRIAIDIKVVEGSKAAIKSINIVGNEAFDESDLLDLFELKTTGWLSWLNNNDKYSREALTGDLERLRSYYLNRGYLEFDVTSSQVAVSQDRSSVYITVNLREGPVYRISRIGMLGDMVVPEEELRRFILLSEGQVYIQSLVTSTREFMLSRLGNEGYTFAEVEEVVELDRENQQVDLSFFVDPGSRVYVRRIEFRGNTRTSDEVLRREMRQMEAAVASNQLIQLGQVRLDRLGHFRQVNSETTPVPGTNDQVDVIYEVEEQSSGSINFSVGYAQYSGLILGLSLEENNFLGTGDSVGIHINRSTYQQSYRFSYGNPYFTPDGVSAGFSVHSTQTDYGEINIATYSTDSFGLNLNFGYPLSEISRLSFGFGYENLRVKTGAFASREITAFAGDGDLFNMFKLNGSWGASTLNRGILPDRGDAASLGFEVAVPGSDVSYYKITAQTQSFVPLIWGTTLRLKTRLGYGDAYGDTARLPFFENFYGGGFGTLRGFRINTLGPRESPLDDFSRRLNPIGGNILILGSADLIIPTPFVPDPRSVQFSLFLDMGNVFDSRCNATQANCSEPDLGNLRSSMGLSATWISGFGPLSFSIGTTRNASVYEEEEFFQFSLGQSF